MAVSGHTRDELLAMLPPVTRTEFETVRSRTVSPIEAHTLSAEFAYLSDALERLAGDIAKGRTSSVATLYPEALRVRPATRAGWERALPSIRSKAEAENLAAQFYAMSELFSIHAEQIAATP
jgi:hypothetical protein